MGKKNQNHGAVRYLSVKLNLLIITLTVLSIISPASLLAQKNRVTGINCTTVNSAPTRRITGSDYSVAIKTPGNVNSSQNEIRPFLSSDGKTLYFSRQHYLFNIPGILGYEDIWCSTYDKIAKMWNEPVNIGPPIRNIRPNSVNYLRITNDTILIISEFRINRKPQEGILMSTIENGEWTFWEPVGTMTEDSLLIFDHNIRCSDYRPILTSSERCDSYGKKDIYVMLINKDRTIRTVNLGPAVNTGQDESSPFLAVDNRTLYFASKGHAGYGRYDIYVTERLDDTWEHWSTPENLGPSVNTANDEEFFTCQPESQSAYFSREPTFRNSNIYQITIPAPQQALKGNTVPVNQY